VFAALAIGFVALLVWALSLTWLAVAERSSLAQASMAQARQLAGAEKVRKQLDSIATGMQKLADGGNANAAGIVAELRKRGVTINPPGPGTSGK
jgi:hypothetical protein